MQLEDLTGEVEYHVADGRDHSDPAHKIARAVIISRVNYPRVEDQSYPHPYRSAYNRETGICISVTQKSLDEGNTWPSETAGLPKA